MSGGPIVNEFGAVVGVNKSFLMNSQNISFGIPVTHLDFLDGHRTLEKDPARRWHQFRSKIALQIQLASTSLKEQLEAFGKAHRANVSRWTYPKVSSEAFVCNSSVDETAVKGIRIHRDYCYPLLSSYLAQSIAGGVVEVHRQVIEPVAKTPDPVPLVRTVQDFYQNFSFWSQMGIWDKVSGHFTPFDCRQSLVKNKSHVKFQTGVCQRRLTYFENLMDADVKLIAKGDKSFITTHLRFVGMKPEDVRVITQFFIDGIEDNATDKPKALVTEEAKDANAQQVF